RTVSGSAVVFCSLSLLIRGHQRARRQAEIPPTAPSEIVEPLLSSVSGMPSKLFDPSYWHDRAREARCYRQTNDPIRDKADDIAESYDHIARLSEEQAKIKGQHKLLD
ncbi:MAG: hypothetical protein WBX25_15235, partial [Rhodomicrobium sp.]